MNPAPCAWGFLFLPYEKHTTCHRLSVLWIEHGSRENPMDEY
jgi:hypothetical protein